MTENNNFSLKLSKEKIELLLGDNDGISHTIGYAEPNKPDLSKNLNIILNQVKSLTDEYPVVDVLLPDDLILQKNLTISEPLSESTATKIMAKMCDLNLEELRLSIGRPTSDLTQPVVAVTTQTIKEARVFLRQAGFYPKRYIAANPIRGFRKKPEFERDLLPKKPRLNRSKIATYVTSIAIIALTTVSFYNILSTKPEIIYTSLNGPVVSKTLLDQKLKPLNNSTEFKDITTDLTTVKKIGNVPSLVLGLKDESFTSKLLETRNSKIRDQLLRVKSEVLIDTSKDTNSFETQDYDKRNNINYVISWIGKNFKKKSEAQIHSTKFTNHKFSKISIPNPVILENGRSSTIKLEKHTKKVTLAMKSDKLISSDKLNFKQLSEPQSSRNTPLQKYFTLDKPSLGQITLEDKKNAISNDNSKQNFEKFFNPKAEKPTLSEFSNLRSVGNTESKLFKRSPENINNQESYTETFSLGKELLPLERPKIIASIKVLLEPTISSGAVTFSNSPVSRPEIVSNQSQLNESDVNLNAKATRGPSFPKRASVISNATMNNILELNRTNLIGIFGTEFNAAALVRLSSGQVIKVKVGDQFQGWRVFAIDKDKIHLANGNKQETLRLPG